MSECYTPCQRYLPLTCPDPNEVVNGCFDPMNAKVCSNIRFTTLVDIFKQFVMLAPTGLCGLSVCDCKDGYLRNRCGKCVPSVDCFKKCCIDKRDPCSQPNEIRVVKYKRRGCRRGCPPLSCKCNRSRKQARKSIDKCDCRNGFVRDHCGQCLPPGRTNLRGECLCSNPCTMSNVTGLEWSCFNECNARYCYVYYEMEVFKNLTCPDTCFFACQCSENQNLWYNGTHCVTAENCPSYENSLLLKEFARVNLKPTNVAQITQGFVNDMLLLLSQIQPPK